MSAGAVAGAVAATTIINSGSSSSVDFASVGLGAPLAILFALGVSLSVLGILFRHIADAEGQKLIGWEVKKE